jgi:hypothetical protein
VKTTANTVETSFFSTRLPVGLLPYALMACQSFWPSVSAPDERMSAKRILLAAQHLHHRLFQIRMFEPEAECQSLRGNDTLAA